MKPQLGDVITFQYIQGEPSPYWVDGPTGEVIDLDGADYAPNLTIRTAEGETIRKETGACVSYKIVEKVGQ